MIIYLRREQHIPFLPAAGQPPIQFSTGSTSYWHYPLFILRILTASVVKTPSHFYRRYGNRFSIAIFARQIQESFSIIPGEGLYGAQFHAAFFRQSRELYTLSPALSRRCYQLSAQRGIPATRECNCRYRFGYGNPDRDVPE